MQVTFTGTAPERYRVYRAVKKVNRRDNEPYVADEVEAEGSVSGSGFIVAVPARTIDSNVIFYRTIGGVDTVVGSINVPAAGGNVEVVVEG